MSFGVPSAFGHETDMAMQSQHVRCAGWNGPSSDAARRLKMTQGDSRLLRRKTGKNAFSDPAMVQRLWWIEQLLHTK
jgi:hypothetical protein